MNDDPERFRIVVHELRSPVAALEALADAARTTHDPATLRRMVTLGIAAATPPRKAAPRKPKAPKAPKTPKATRTAAALSK